MTKKDKKIYKGGYEKVFLFINRSFNFSLSLLLIIISIPIFLFIAFIIKIQDGGPIIYKQKRLGLNKKEFVMYKFRSLVPNADDLTKGRPIEAVCNRHKLMTPFGKFLRETRLDELPQLFNILKGDMDFIGPRPQPSDFYKKFWQDVKDYDKRFSVRPGLIGYPQLFLPHSAPKRIQALVDNKFIKKKQKFLSDTYFVLLTIVIVMLIIFNRTVKYIWNMIIKSNILGLYKEKRILDRIGLEKALVHIGPQINEQELAQKKERLGDLIDSKIFTKSAELIDINEEAILILSDHKIEGEAFIFEMEIDFRSIYRRGKKKKTALCLGRVYRETEVKNDKNYYKYIIKYKPISPLNEYIVHQYFLSESMIE